MDLIELFNNMFFTYEFIVKNDPVRAKAIPTTDYLIAYDQDKKPVLVVKAFNIWSEEDRNRLMNDQQLQTVLNMILPMILKAGETPKGQRPFERAQGQGG